MTLPFTVFISSLHGFVFRENAISSLHNIQPFRPYTPPPALLYFLHDLLPGCSANSAYICLHGATLRYVVADTVNQVCGLCTQLLPVSVCVSVCLCVCVCVFVAVCLLKAFLYDSCVYVCVYVCVCECVCVCVEGCV